MKFLVFLILCLPNFGYAQKPVFDLLSDYFMPIAAAAYSDNPSQCWTNIQNYFAYSLKNMSLTFSIYRQYTVRCESMNDTCSGYIAVNTECVEGWPARYVLVAFRGTNNTYAFFENGWNYDEMVPFIVGGKVSKVFFDGFNSIWNSGMRDDLYTLKNKYRDIEFYFLGGAMASLAAATFQNITAIDPLVNLYTFGQPRIGDKDFAKAFNKMGFNSQRIIHKADIVPHLPPLNQTAYYHHGEEEWYNNDMGIFDHSIDCYDEEDPKCSNSLNSSEYNMNDHKYYCGRDFIEYGKNGCPDLATSKYNTLKNMDINIRGKHFKS